MSQNIRRNITMTLNSEQQMSNITHFQQPVSHLQFAQGLCYSSWCDGLDEDPPLSSNHRETQTSCMRLLQIQRYDLLLHIHTNKQFLNRNHKKWNCRSFNSELLEFEIKLYQTYLWGTKCCKTLWILWIFSFKKPWNPWKKIRLQLYAK